jgi:hypothetical protein
MESLWAERTVVDRADEDEKRQWIGAGKAGQEPELYQDRPVNVFSLLVLMEEQIGRGQIFVDEFIQLFVTTSLDFIFFNSLSCLCSPEHTV